MWRKDASDVGSVSFSGRGFTDGSLIGKTRVGGQAGWAAIERRPGATEASAVIFGCLPVALPVQRRILRAELWALWRMLVHSMPPLTVHIDNSSVVLGFHMGRRWCCSSGRPHADVWRKIWHVIDDIGVGPNGIEVRKCKSHVSKRTRATLSAEAQEIFSGNDEVDSFAKQGAGLDVIEVAARKRCAAPASRSGAP